MSKKIKKIPFRRNDDLRVLLTEVLPYEVPLPFSNVGFYKRLRSGANKRIIERCKVDLFKSGWTIPYSYSIRKDACDFRQLSIVHPAVQREFCSLYKKYAQLIIGLCSRSSFTLRRPSKVATHYYEKARASRFISKEPLVEVDADGFSPQDKHASSYFSYKSYHLIHKFYDSPEFHNLEKKYRILRTLDVAKCFNHIYTHSLSWAAKSKEFGKSTVNATTFESEFDNLMQRANYNETNGIVIGPEVSRIFAEIILQSADMAVLRELADQNIVAGQDYDVRRYVDDYFVFTNDEKIADIIQAALAKQLSRFKLYLNGAKTNTVSRPFVTGQTRAKIELGLLLDRMFEQHTRSKQVLREELDKHAMALAASPGKDLQRPFVIRYVGNAEALSATYIRDIKLIVDTSETSFDAVANYFFTVVSRKLNGLLERISPAETTRKEFERSARFIRTVLESVFFVYAMAPRVRATYQVSSLCLVVNEFALMMPRDAQEYIKSFIAEQIRTILTGEIHRCEGDNVEIINLTTVLRAFGDEYLLSQRYLCDIYDIEFTQTGQLNLGRRPFGYYQIVTILQYIGNLERYNGLQQAVCNHVHGLLNDHANLESVQQNTEMTLLVFDYLNCPHVPMEIKLRFAKDLLRKVSDKDLATRATELIKIISEGNWFFDWDIEKTLGAVLWKKELRSAY